MEANLEGRWRIFGDEDKCLRVIYRANSFSCWINYEIALKRQFIDALEK